MKKYLSIVLILFAVMTTETSCESNNPVLDPNEPIKGHVFSTKTNVFPFIELTFNNDMSVIYRYQNTWDKDAGLEPYRRDDLNYTIDSAEEFSIFVNGQEDVWGAGVFHQAKNPYITVSNFYGDTLYLKK